MPSDRTVTTLREILQHIDLADQFLKGHNPADFAQDVRTVYAVTRCLEIISEATRRLPDDLKARHPHTEWRQIAAAGNIYRHEYEDVAPRIIWETVRVALPGLRGKCDYCLMSKFAVSNKCTVTVLRRCRHRVPWPPQ